MALIIKLLEAKSIAAGSLTTVYSSTASTLVANIRLATRTTSGTVNLYYFVNGGSYHRILDVNKALIANDLVVVKPEITMGPGDIIKASTSTAMDCVVSGFTRD